MLSVVADINLSKEKPCVVTTISNVQLTASSDVCSMGLN